jgi:ABC-type Fe3+ transport system permease subunit
MVQLGWLNSFAALIVPAMFTAFGVFLMRQFILGVPQDYIESARLDGCGEFRVIGQIVFPLVREPAAALAILIFLYHWNDLFWPLLVMRQQTAYTLSQALYYLHGAYGTNYHLKLAAAALVVIPPIVVYLRPETDHARHRAHGHQGLADDRTSLASQGHFTAFRQRPVNHISIQQLFVQSALIVAPLTIRNWDSVGCQKAILNSQESGLRTAVIWCVRSWTTRYGRRRWIPNRAA